MVEKIRIEYWTRREENFLKDVSSSWKIVTLKKNLSRIPVLTKQQLPSRVGQNFKRNLFLN